MAATQPGETYLSALAPELSILLGDELLAGNQIGEIWIGREPEGVRVVLRQPFQVPHVLPAGVVHRQVKEGRKRRDEFVSVRTAHVLVSGPSTRQRFLGSGE